MSKTTKTTTKTKTKPAPIPATKPAPIPYDELPEGEPEFTLIPDFIHDPHISDRAFRMLLSILYVDGGDAWRPGWTILYDRSDFEGDVFNLGASVPAITARSAAGVLRELVAARLLCVKYEGIKMTVSRGPLLDEYAEAYWQR